MSHSRPVDRQMLRELRKRLALDRLAPEASAALLSTSADSQRLAQRHAGQVPADGSSPVARRLARHVVTVAVHEFALLAATQPVTSLTAPELFRRVGHAEAASQLAEGTTEGLLAVVATTIREQISRHPVLGFHTVALHTSLRRYTDYLRPADDHRHHHPHQPTTSETAPTECPDNVAPFLYHELIQHFGTRVQQACVTVQVAIPTPEAPNDTLSPPDANPDDGVIITATDHLVFVHPGSFLSAPSGGTGPVLIGVNVGPVPVHDLVRAYQSALLLARMVRLGWSRPLASFPCRPHSPSDVPLEVLEQITPHLGPLIATPLPHRIELARTLHRVLTTPSTMQQHAKALNISPSTLRQRLVPLQPILQQNVLTPHQTAVLGSVLPALGYLWKTELTQRQQGPDTPDFEITITFDVSPPPPPPPPPPPAPPQPPATPPDAP